MTSRAVILVALVAACSDSSAPYNPSPARYYVANKGSSSITVYTTADTGNTPPAFTISGTNTTLDQPEGIVLDPVGVLLATSANPPRILIFAANSIGDVAPIASIVGNNTRLGQPKGLALDQMGRLYVANTGNDTILVFARGASGNVAPVATIGGSNTALNAPEGISFDFRGRVYVTNLLGNRITVFAAGASGNIAPVDTIAGPSTGLNGPMGIALDPAGRIYVANSGASPSTSSITVYAATAHGNATPTATITGSNTLLDQPQGLVLDAAGRIFVANSAIGSHQYRITVYSATANGDVAPAATLTGASTGLSVPSHLAF